MALPKIYVGQNELLKDQVKKELDDYTSFYNSPGDTERRKANYSTVVNYFYDLVTDVYQYAWGESFHFATRWKGETFRESIVRAEYYLALRLQLKKGCKVLDAGCGVGGPARNISRFSGAKVTGLNINEYQINKATDLTKNAGLTDLCDFVKGDFSDIPLANNTYDAAYAIEATCHSLDRTKTFSEISRVLKPGGVFAGYEWCLTPKYDSKDAEHQRVKFGIMKGNGLHDISSEQDVIDALKAAGFEVIEAFDANGNQHKPGEIPWYHSMNGDYASPPNFTRTPIGSFLSSYLVGGLERLRIIPEGTSGMHALIYQTAQDLKRGGQLEIFTPGFFFLARKPTDN